LGITPHGKNGLSGTAGINDDFIHFLPPYTRKTKVLLPLLFNGAFIGRGNVPHIQGQTAKAKNGRDGKEK
jgi:hypothetical protein